jgi:hypothetical protein
MIIEAINKARKERDARPQFPKERRREPCRKTAMREVRITQPAAAMPMA